MLFRLVRPVKRFGSSMNYFVQRIPGGVKARAVDLKLAIPLGAFTQSHTITAKARSVRFSFRTRDPAETKLRQTATTAHLETVWQSLRATKPTSAISMRGSGCHFAGNRLKASATASRLW